MLTGEIIQLMTQSFTRSNLQYNQFFPFIVKNYEYFMITIKITLKHSIQWQHFHHLINNSIVTITYISVLNGNTNLT